MKQQYKTIIIEVIKAILYALLGGVAGISM